MYYLLLLFGLLFFLKCLKGILKRFKKSDSFKNLQNIQADVLGGLIG
jgi:hypothetical protein